mmetsp:Transcript_49342/g.88119  ORF Transcript_49342/g.88119 Transcript_49342/m.88119 type:complete len:323 (-) Transcript_49342:6-974(-)
MQPVHPIPDCSPCISRGGALPFELAFPFLTSMVIIAEFHGLPAIQRGEVQVVGCRRQGANEGRLARDGRPALPIVPNRDVLVADDLAHVCSCQEVLRLGLAGYDLLVPIPGDDVMALGVVLARHVHHCLQDAALIWVPLHRVALNLRGQLPNSARGGTKDRLALHPILGHWGDLHLDLAVRLVRGEEELFAAFCDLDAAANGVHPVPDNLRFSLLALGKGVRQLELGIDPQVASYGEVLDLRQVLQDRANGVSHGQGVGVVTGGMSRELTRDVVPAVPFADLVRLLVLTNEGGAPVPTRCALLPHFGKVQLCCQDLPLMWVA